MLIRLKGDVRNFTTHILRLDNFSVPAASTPLTSSTAPEPRTLSVWLGTLAMGTVAFVWRRRIQSP